MNKKKVGLVLMSGGAFNYISGSVLYEYKGRMEDPELEDLLKDFCALLHDLEWYKSGDTSQENYCKSVATFKDKWFKKPREDRLKNYIKEELKNVEDRLIAML